ncbi:cell envelope biogenesis protein TolA, partial [Sphingomonas koreensis]
MAVALDRGEGTGLGLALLGHLVLFGLLTVGFLATPNPAKLEPTPIEISLTDEAGLKSEAPVINREAPAERLAEVPAPPPSASHTSPPAHPPHTTRVCRPRPDKKTEHTF